MPKIAGSGLDSAGRRRRGDIETGYRRGDGRERCEASAAADCSTREVMRRRRRMGWAAEQGDCRMMA